MSGMGDSSSATTRDAFTKLLRYLEPIQCQPTIDENDLIEPTARQAELARRVCTQDCVVALGTAEMRRQLIITFLLTLKPSRAVIVGEKICQDVDFLDHLRLFLPQQVCLASSTTSRSLEGFPGAYVIAETEMLWTLLKDGVLRASDIDALVLRDFDRYLGTGHAFREVVSFLKPTSAAMYPMRVLALADELQVDSIDDLEWDLRRLRTPLRLNCCLGTPAAPYAKEVAVEHCPLEVYWTGNENWQRAIHTVSCSKDPKVQDVGTALTEWGVSVASGEALKIFEKTARSELAEFLLLSRMALTPLKGYAVLNYVQGRTLALTNTATSMHDLDEWLRQEGSATVIGQPDEVALALSVVFVATMADMPTLRRYCWDAVVLCDLPFAVSCDALFANADRKVALATESEWKRWTDLLELHDELDSLLVRVNDTSVPEY
ncbi:hypothetical protein HPB50_012979 [Hyalomma asiaticum]|uniref:Uncharacterized protein n=1 Tax=Hyalomma asiaticum TaxID=266040 RepID=A0ACB7SN62_HYAAI|nr:hypothetical protein HPB50_012979 [Hyalomma asiaticum]